jgi:hypothetical protein
VENHIPELVAGGMLAALGIISIVRKQLSFGLLGGRTGVAGPLITLKLTGKRAIFCGVFSLLGALIALVPWLYVYTTHNLNATNDSTLPVAAIIGIIVAALGLAICYFFEYLSLAQDSVAVKKDDF